MGMTTMIFARKLANIITSSEQKNRLEICMC